MAPSSKRPVPPHANPKADGGATLPLNERFLFSHEPISERIPLRLLDRDALVQDFKMRVRYSTGGAFLITGFRGVGKTSFVTYALEQLEKETRGAHILPIYINLSRRLSATEVMHHIVRQIHSELEARHLYNRFGSLMRTLIETANQRTAYAMKSTRGLSESVEGSMGLPAFAGVALGGKSARSLSSQQSMDFLGYDDKAAEYDIIRILRGLNTGYRHRIGRGRTPIRPIIIFDELDKLDLANEDGKAYLLDVISTLKAILTTSGSIFIFIGGKDLYRVWLSDQRGPDSIYESVFAHDMYLPCLWNLSEPLLDSVLMAKDTSGQPELAQWRDKLRDHLAFTGRGIARRMMRELNRLVSLESDKLAIRLNATLQQRVRFYADIEALINENINQILQNLTERIVSDAQFDDYRQFLYFVADFMLRSGGRPFSREGAIFTFKDYPLYRENPGTSEQLLDLFIDVLLRTHYLDNADDGANAATKLYKMSGWALGRMRRAMKFGDFEYTVAPELPYGGQLGQYHLIEILGAGGIADVFEAQDMNGRAVALKAMRAKSDPAWMQVAELVMDREREILNQRLHPNIVAPVEDGSHNPVNFFVMELVRGISLTDVIRTARKGLPPVEAAAIIRALCEPVEALHNAGYVRLDLTPSNVLLEAGTQRRLVLIDVGTALHLGQPEPDALYSAIGTPGYMAPESAHFNPDVGINQTADIYALGILLYLLLVGPRGMSALQGSQNIVTDWLPPEFVPIIQNATQRNPLYRWGSATAFAAMLPAGPPIEEVIARLQGVKVERKARQPAAPVDQTGIEPLNPDDEITNIVYGDAPPPRPVAPPEPSAFGESAVPQAALPSAPSYPWPSPVASPPPATASRSASARGTDTQKAVPPSEIRSIELQIYYAPPDVQTVIPYTLRFPTSHVITIGRAADNVVVLEDIAVSRYNAEITEGTRLTLTQSAHYLRPMRDSATMLLDGERILGGSIVSHGSIIQLGNTFITFLYSADPVIQTNITIYPTAPAGQIAPPPPPLDQP